jgi:adenosylhomocysteine nucleosidase
MKASHIPSENSLSADYPWLGMVAAFPWEIRPLLRAGTRRTFPPPKLNRSEGIQVRSASHSKIYALSLGGRPALLTVAGAGAENSFRAAQRLTENFSLYGLVTLGFAGGLALGLRPGDVVLGDEVMDEANRERFACDTDLIAVRFARRGRLLSANAVVTSSAQKLRLGKEWGAVAVDMESSGVARAAALAGLPFCAVKSITDSAEQSLSIDFARCRSENGGFSVWAIAWQGLTNSKGARDLWTLAKNSRQAAGALATALVPV